MSIVVFDLEFTCWEGSLQRGWSGPGEHREIVQIGALRLDDALTEVEAVEMLVRPRLNPRLSDYFIALTGITQQAVDADGLDFPEALARLARFAGPRGVFFSNGPDGAVIAENCHLLGIAPPIAADCFHDLRARIGHMAGAAAITSCDLAAAFGLDHTGAAHTALADARAVAATLRLGRQRGAIDLAALMASPAADISRG